VRVDDIGWNSRITLRSSLALNGFQGVLAAPLIAPRAPCPAISSLCRVNSATSMPAPLQQGALHLEDLVFRDPEGNRSTILSDR
jgi:hypothetical protein